ncbi:MAG: hypothetical protein JWQ70_1340, partial [Aeromicrobium sp.]|nr:hypothetical protein [Aeromicrobium sp.]
MVNTTKRLRRGALAILATAGI